MPSFLSQCLVEMEADANTPFWDPRRGSSNKNHSLTQLRINWPSLSLSGTKYLNDRFQFFTVRLELHWTMGSSGEAGVECSPTKLQSRVRFSDRHQCWRFSSFFKALLDVGFFTFSNSFNLTSFLLNLLRKRTQTSFLAWICGKSYNACNWTFSKSFITSEWR